MAWKIEVGGVVTDDSFASEEQANQAAANIRGNDWLKKIAVFEEPAPEPPSDPKQPPAPKK